MTKRCITVERTRGFSQRFGELWFHGDFLKLWIGQTISLAGSQVTTLALPLTAIVLLKASPAQLGLLSAAEFAPFLFLTVFAGVVINHTRRRPLLIITNIGSAILLGLIPVLALMGWLRIEYLYGIALLVGCLTVFFSLAFQAFLPTLLEGKHLIEGNSKLSASQSIAELSGPGLAGIVVQLVTAPFAISIDACSFLVAAMSLIRMHASETRPAPSKELRGLWHEAVMGFKLTFSNAYLRAFAGEAATYNLFWQMILTVFVLYAVRNLHYNSTTIGLLFSVGSAGALCGALLTGPVARRIGVGITVITAAILSDLPMLLLPIVTNSTRNSWLLLFCAFFVQGIGITGCNVHVTSMRQALIPDALRGCANASYRLLVSGMLPLGALLSGFLGTWIGLRWTLLIASGSALHVALASLFSHSIPA